MESVKRVGICYLLKTVTLISGCAPLRKKKARAQAVLVYFLIYFSGQFSRSSHARLESR